MRLDSPLCKHIRFPLEIAFIIKHFQRTQKKIALVGRKGKIITSAVDKTVFLGIAVVQAV